MRTPTSAHATRLSALFRRRLTTAWSEKVVKALRTLVKAKCFDTLDDLALLEAYYAFERKKGERGLHRRDLYTLLNNWHGEIDRANAWRELHPLKQPPRVIIPGPFSRPEPYVAPTDPAELERIARFDAERLARKGRIL